ncbi:MORN repeat-containing protein [Lacticaseibacillus daqingensis]|uniref:hypothetical protein n=1 Tax=Lacticaseibacillus daqingensis TaxID=2486014 RepID=UPI000F781296|nr:hypothetical protein [Lacticaseibacillus daqingensis]
MAHWHSRALAELLCTLTIGRFAWAALKPQTPQTAAYTLDDQQIRYTGQVFKDQFSGTGTLTFKNGDRYTGHFKAGRFNGEGTFTSHSGWQYQGHFKAGAVSGAGVLTTAKHQTYRGTFANGQYRQAHTSTH